MRKIMVPVRVVAPNAKQVEIAAKAGFNAYFPPVIAWDEMVDPDPEFLAANAARHEAELAEYHARYAEFA